MSQATCNLFVTLAGFDAGPARALTALLEDCSALGARWRVVDSGSSDLWIIDGAKARSAGNGVVDVLGEKPMRLRPADMPQPVAFAEPLHGDISTGYRFDATSMHALNVLLAQLGRSLTPRLMQQALMAQLIANGASFTRSNVIEVRQGHRLLAVIDFDGDTAVAPDATPADLPGADWSLHPRRSYFVPPGFRTAPTCQALWHACTRGEKPPRLPARYLRLPIHLREVPALHPRDLDNRQLQLVRELAYAPHTLAELSERTACGAAAVQRDLACLYLIGSITCDPGRSRAARVKRLGAAARSNEDLSFIGARPSTLDELTAPGFFPGARAGAATLSS